MAIGAELRHGFIGIECLEAASLALGRHGCIKDDRALNKHLVLQLDEQLFFELDPKESGVVQWVFDHGERAGLSSDTLPGASALYLPLVGSKGPIGVLAVRPTLTTRFLDPEQLHLLEILANQIALALERARLAEEAQQAHVSVETERMRNAILSSVSHDLRTPLATITGAASGLLEEKDQLNPASRHELAKSIYHEAHRRTWRKDTICEYTCAS